MERVHLDRIAIRSAAEIRRSVAEVDESIEALIHPGVQTLVRPDDHREPFVPELVRDYPLLILTRAGVRRERQHRVLHARDRSFDGCPVRPWVAVPLLAEVLDRLPADSIHLLPLVGLRSIEILDQDSIVP